MSIRAMKAIAPVRLKGPPKAVLLALAWHHNDSGGCYPSIAAIAAFAGCSERTVQTALRELTRRGFATPAGKGKGRTERWKINAHGNGQGPLPKKAKTKRTATRAPVLQLIQTPPK